MYIIESKMDIIAENGPDIQKMVMSVVNQRQNQNSRQTYYTALTKFFDWYVAGDNEGIDANIIREYLLYLENYGKSKATISTSLSVLRQLFKDLRRLEVIDEKIYKLHALPSGVVRGGKLSIIGNGVVLDPWHLLSEIETLTGQGVTIDAGTLKIAENTPLILPVHGELDRAREAQSGIAKIGTTGRGIGPAYEDKVGRRSIRVMDLRSEKNLDQRLDSVLIHHNACLLYTSPSPRDS